MRIWIASGLFTVLLVGCWPPEPPEELRCADASPACPMGQLCDVDNRCRRSPRDFEVVLSDMDMPPEDGDMPLPPDLTLADLCPEPDLVTTNYDLIVHPDSGGGTCNDGVQNGDETDVDCGGAVCARCATNQVCNDGPDCIDRVCTNRRCTPTCSDGTLNGTETDTDCGGSCPPCQLGRICAPGAQCAESSGGDPRQCVTPQMQCNPVSRCQAASTCENGALDPGETDVDCGRPACVAKCADGRNCTDGPDCISGVCTNRKCATLDMATRD